LDRKTVVLILTYKRFREVELTLEVLVTTKIPCLVSIDRDESLTEGEQGKIIQRLEKQFPDVFFKSAMANQGLVNHLVNAIEDCFKTFDNVIVLEDDIRVSRTVVLATESLLRSRLPIDVLTVSLFPGIPSIPPWRNKRNLWRRSHYFCPWGFALQKEDWNEFQITLPPNATHKLENFKTVREMSQRRKKVWEHRVGKVLSNPKFTYDTQFQYSLFQTGKRSLVPLFRASENSGFGDGFAIHTKGEKPKWIFGKAHRACFKPQPTQSKFLEMLGNYWDSLTIGGDRKIRVSAK